MAHRQLSKIDRAAIQLQEIAPLRDTVHVFCGVSIDFLDVRIHDADAGQFSSNVRRRQQLLRVQENIVAGDFHSGNVPWMKKVVNFNVKPAQETFQRNLQNIELGNMDLDAVAGSDTDRGYHLHGQWNNLMQSAVELDRVSVA